MNKDYLPIIFAGDSPPEGGTEDPDTIQANQKLYLVDMVGEGEVEGFASGNTGTLPYHNIYFDGIPLIKEDGSTNYPITGSFLLYYTLGTSGQSGMEGFSQPEISLKLPSNTQVKCFTGADGKLTYQDVIVGFNTAQFPNPESIKITTYYPSLMASDSDGNITAYRIAASASLSVNDSPFIEWQSATPTDNYTPIITYEKSSNGFFQDTILPITPLAGVNNYKIRVRRHSPNPQTVKVYALMNVSNISVKLKDEFSYPHTAMIATRLESSQFSSIPSRLYDMKLLKINIPDNYDPIARTYDGFWMGEFATNKQWSNNPAWVFYDLLTNPRYGLGEYIKAEWVDKFTLYEIAQYCDELVNDGNGGLEPRFSCNIMFYERQEAYDLLNNLVSVFRGMIYYINGRVVTNQDSPKTQRYLFTNANVINGAFSYSSSSKRVRKTVALIRWVDPDRLWSEQEEYIEDAEAIVRYGYNQTEALAVGCTSRGQAMRVGRWILLTEFLDNETVLFRTALQGFALRPGDVFQIQDNYRHNSNLGGRVTSYDASRINIQVDRPLNIFGEKNYLTCVVPKMTIESTGITGSDQVSLIRNSQIETKLITGVTGSGITNFSVESAFSSTLFTGATFIFQSLIDSGAQPTSYRCLATSEAETNIIEVLGLKYSSGRYADSEKGYSTNVSPNVALDTTIPDTPSGFNAILYTGMTDIGMFSSYADVSWSGESITSLAYYKISGSIDTGVTGYIGTANFPAIEYYINATGYYKFFIEAIGKNAAHSAASLTGGFLIPGINPLGSPPLVSGIYLSQGKSTNSTGDQFIGRTPQFSWVIGTGNRDPKRSFYNGCSFSIYDQSNVPIFYKDMGLKSTSDTNYYGYSYKLTEEDLANFTGGQVRDWSVRIETRDIFSKTITGGSGTFHNPPTTISSSGFSSARSAFYFDLGVYPEDFSGIAFWVDENPAFVPTWQNKTKEVNVSNGITNHPINSNTVYNVWWAVLDTFGTSGTTIYGPTGLNSSGTFGVSTINADTYPGLEGDVTFAGLGGTTVTQIGQTIYIEGGAGGGGSSPFTGINVTGQIVSGVPIMSGQGGLVVYTKGNIIIFSGGAGGGGTSYTGTAGVATLNSLVGELSLASAGNVSVIQTTPYTLSISGERPPMTLAMFMPQPVTGLNLVEATTSKAFTATGLYITCVDTSVSNIYGRVYTAPLSSPTSKTTISVFSLAGGSNNNTIAIPNAYVGPQRRIGFEITGGAPGSMSKLVVCVHGIDTR